MPDPVTAVVGGASLIGANRSAKSAERAAQTSADAQLEAARIAAEEARFRPVGITSRFGASNFVIDPETGRLTSAGYDVSPDIAALRERLISGAGGALGQAQGLDLSQIAGTAGGLFGLGSQFLPSSTQAMASPEAMQFASQLRGYGQQFLPSQVSMEASPEAMAQAQGLFNLQRQVTPTSYDPTAAAQKYFEEQQAMLDPARQRQEQRLGASVFGRGRAGLNISGQGQPELFALGQARGEQDLALAAQARERARQELQQDIGLGTGLGLQGLSTQQQAQELARQRGFQDIGFGLDLTGRALGAGESATDLARQRLAQDIGLGTGLFGTGLGFLGQIPQLQTAALSPFQTQLGLAQLLESMGQQPLSLGAELGGGNAASAQALLQGGLGAAQTGMQGSLASAGIRAGATQDLLRQIPGLFGSGTQAPAPIYDQSVRLPVFSSQNPYIPSTQVFPVSGWGGTSTPIYGGR
jgi:hypothetical protein